MADRKCSCCGEYYTDETGHNLNQCIENCEALYMKAVNNLTVASENLQKAYHTQIAILKYRIQKEKVN
jgi:hypothetical protein